MPSVFEVQPDKGFERRRARPRSDSKRNLRKNSTCLVISSAVQRVPAYLGQVVQKMYYVIGGLGWLAETLIRFIGSNN